MSARHSLYGSLLRLYPASFRREYGFALREAYAARTEPLTGIVGAIEAVAIAFADVVPNALAAHADILLRDIKHGFRVMRRSPVLYGASFLILAIGIGANGAIFSLLQAVLLEPLPYRDPSRVVMLWEGRVAGPTEPVSTKVRERWNRGILTSEQVLGFREHASDVFEDIATIESWQGGLDTQFDIQRPEGSERLRGARVTPNFFRLLGVQAQHGRLFDDRDAAENNTPIVISHRLWTRMFGADQRLVGQSISLASGRGSSRTPKSFTVIGILPPEFHFTYPEETEAWAMMTWSDVARLNPNALLLRAVARIRDGRTHQVAEARFRDVFDQVDRIPPGQERRTVGRMEPIESWVIGESRSSLLLLAAVSLLLFVSTCTTVANTLFIRVTAKRRELAIRAALGAEPRRLIRQLLTEGTLLALVGAVLGSIVSVAMLPLLRRYVPGVIPRADEIGVSVWIVAFAAAAAASVIVFAAFMPALQAGRVKLAAALKRAVTHASADQASIRWRSGLVATQSAIAASLLVVACLLTATAWKLTHVPLGFYGNEVLTFEMRLLDASRRDPQVLASFQSELMARVRAVPGVQAAGLTSAVPFRGVDFLRGVDRPGSKDVVMGNERFVDSSFFEVMGIQLRAGRNFNSADRIGTAPVIVLSRAFSRAMFGNENSVGKQIVFDDSPVTVVGVVDDVRYQSLDVEPAPAYYLPMSQQPSMLFCIVARTMGNAHAAVLAAVRQADPQMPVMGVTTIDRIVAESISVRRFYTSVTVAAALLALLLTAAGLVLIVVRSIAERRHELAIRGALGATAGRLVRMVTIQGVTPVVAGGAIGLVLAFAVADRGATFLYQVSPREPIAYLLVAGVIALCGVLAALVPAVSITRLHPAESLRSD